MFLMSLPRKEGDKEAKLKLLCCFFALSSLLCVKPNSPRFIKTHFLIVATSENPLNRNVRRNKSSALVCVCAAEKGFDKIFALARLLLLLYFCWNLLTHKSWDKSLVY